MTAPPSDPVNHPAHYTAHPSGYECIDITRHMTYAAGNAVKYVWRTDLKNGRQDLEKASWYLRDALDHFDKIFISLDDRLDAQAKIDAVAETETAPWRRLFFVALNDLDLEWALGCVGQMLEEGDA